MVNNLRRTSYSRQFSLPNQQQRSGRSNRFLQSDAGAIDWLASLLHAKPSPTYRQQRNKYRLTTLVRRPRYPKLNHLNIILLDTSASTLCGAGLQQSKAVVAAINNLAYVKREHLALFCFGNNQVRMQIPPSKPRKSLDGVLNNIPAGGGTPFRSALLTVKQLLERRKRHQQAETTAVFILTDGRSRGDVADINLDTKTTLIDMECGSLRLKRCYAIAQQWRAAYVHVDSIPWIR